MSGRKIEVGRMETIFIPENEVELVMVRGLLEAEQIPFHVRNDHFGGLYIGPQIQHFNQRTIMVPPEYAERSREIVAEYVASQNPQEPEPYAHAERPTALEKLRLLGEALLFSWIVPRKRRKRSFAPQKWSEKGINSDKEAGSPASELNSNAEK
jgi:hypothetical protein